MPDPRVLSEAEVEGLFNGILPGRTEDHMVSLRHSLRVARAAAQHFRYCDLAGSEIEFRCEDCQAASRALGEEG